MEKDLDYRREQEYNDDQKTIKRLKDENRRLKEETQCLPCIPLMKLKVYYSDNKDR